jgi:hypothetical protein
MRAALNIYRAPPGGHDLPPLMLYKQYIYDDKATMCARCYTALTATKRQRGAPPGEDSTTIDDRHSLSAPVVKAPRYSLAAGVNFSDFASLNLPVPSLAEVLCIAKARPFVGHMKVSPTGDHHDERGTLKGHLCTLLHDAPNVFSAALPNLDVTKRLAVWFLGFRTQYNSAAQSGRLRRLLKTVVEVRCTESMFKLRRVHSPNHVSRAYHALQV